MHHLLSSVLLVTTTTTPKKSSAPSALLWALFAVEFAVGFGLAEARRWVRGTYPWRLHALVWGMLTIITQGLAVVFLAVAWFTTRPRPTDPPGRLAAAGRPSLRELLVQRRTGSVPGPAALDAPPSGVVPGTYGTSLPPHASGDGSGDPSADEPLPVGEPAGWRPDPTGRHEYRYWNGSGWSRHVADRGRRSVDAM